MATKEAKSVYLGSVEDVKAAKGWGDEARAAMVKDDPAIKEDSLPPSDHEIELMQRLRAQITEKSHLDQLTDRHLITFLRGWVLGKYKDLPEDEGMNNTIPVLQNAQRFRAKYNARDILQTKELPSRTAFNREWINGATGCDSTGRQIQIFTLVTTDFTKIFPLKKQEDFIRNQVRSLAQTDAWKDEKEKTSNGRLLYKHILIVDLGSSSLTMKKVNYLKNIMAWGEGEEKMNFLQDFYPETLYTLWAVNTPFLFNAIWKVAKNFIDPITAAKFNLRSGIPLKEMEKAGIPASCVPKYLGGTGPDPPGYHYKFNVSAGKVQGPPAYKMAAGQVAKWDVGTSQGYSFVTVCFNGKPVAARTKLLQKQYVPGTFTAPEDGVLELKFDNTEYRWSSCDVFFEVYVSDPPAPPVPVQVAANGASKEAAEASSSADATPPPAPPAE